MLNRLSKFQQEIAVCFITLFLIGDIIPYKANAAAYNNAANANYFNSSHYSTACSNDAKGYEDKKYTQPNELATVGKSNVEFKNEKPKPSINKLAPTKLVSSNKGKAQDKPSIGGPGQPEMGAFKPVGADNMVDLFSGDMSYNIPLLDVGGYPVNIFYNSSITMDQEASWAGLGWNINPGTIMRNMRGVPDDFNGTDVVTKTLSMKDDETWGVGIGGGIEIAGTPIGIGGNLGVSFNNMRGMGMDFGVNAHVSLSKGAADEKTNSLTLGVGLNLNSQSGATVTPSISVSKSEANNKVGTSSSGSLSASVGYNSRTGLQALHIDAEVSKTKTTEEIKKSKTGHYESGNSNTSSMSVMSSSISFAYPSVTPSIRARLSRLGMTANLKVGNAAFFLHPNGSLNGYYTQSRIAEEDKVTTHPAYGVMFYQKANNDINALLDFNRLQDGVFTKNNPTIAIPTYNYDVFSISGEGVGGSFRAYRGDLGYVHDATVSTRDDAGKIGFDIGIGALAAHGGVNLEYVYSPTTAGSWDASNFANNSLKFRETKADTQMVYFKNPGEKTIPDINFQNAIGGENLVRLKMAGYNTGSPVLLPVLEKFNNAKTYLNGEDKPLVTNDIIKGKRDKRTQVISYLSAEEASRVGFDKEIKSYSPAYAGVVFGNCNNNGITSIKRNTGISSYTGSDKYRKAHHISEINVLGGDGRKYVYGIPVYNTQQIDATFNVNGGDANTQKVGYQLGDDTKANAKGRDWYIEKEEMPAYTHSFLLTELVSPNYVDLKGDGITEDDMGDAVKFNYSKFDDIKWRNPIGTNVGTYNEGFKTNTEDGKAHYTYGKREQWYLYSVESKNMVAKFYVKNDRRDGKAVLGVDGTLDPNYGAQRLEKIALFSKGDLVKYGTAAKPIKTVYLEYDYSLCGNTPTNNGDALPDPNHPGVNLNANKGKLTLRSIYFTYNGNERAKKNKYTFHYPSEKNPDYNYTANDRWGNYKPSVADAIDGGGANNLGGLSNSDYPYSVQNKAKADKYAGAWVMDSIGLPSGGKIKIDYEADDYAYVQDRRASTMYQVSGFGNTKTPSAAQLVNNRLYDVVAIPGAVASVEYQYIYATLPLPISTTQSASAQQRELQSKYFNSYKNNQPGQLLVKLNVQVQPGDGFEIVPFYADVESYGLIAPTSGSTSNKIYIKVKRLDEHTPMVQYTLSFLKNNLPGKAFPGFDNTSGGLEGVVRALSGMFNSLKELFSGVDNNLKSQNKCRFVDNSKSFVRLTNPYFSKEGGGLRVKKVTIHDNWDKMTGQAKATYGQEYKYTKQELINDKVETISSGVASWEPAIGGEENPHREIMTYSNHNKGGPFDYNSVEFPLAEMFFPSASVGYSHVEVLPIHRDTVKNAVGKSTTDYFTTRDFPTKSDYTFMSEGDGASFHEDPTVFALLRIRASKHYALSQGFKVDLNDMNGKVRLQESFGANNQPISHTENFYNIIQNKDEDFKFNHNFQTLNGPNGVLTNSLIGRDIELMTDMRNHNAQTISTNVNINIDGQMIGIFPIIIPPLLSPVFFEENDYRSASMLKIVNHFGMQDSTVVVDKGSRVSTKNLVYDAETGNVLLTRTNNEYDKPIYNFTYPAHWAYSGMGPAYKNIDVVYNNLTFRNGIIENAVQQNVDFKNFESGDELYVYSPLTNGPLLTSCDQGVCSLPKNPANRIWAVNTNKTGGPDKVAFMDAQGNPYQAMQVTMRIIRSGRRNMLEQMVGGITSLKSPIVNGQLVFNDATGIIQTSAATFKDHWRVDGATCSTIIKECILTNKNSSKENTTKENATSANSTLSMPVNDEPCGAIVLDVSNSCNYVIYTNVDATNSSGVGIPDPTPFIDCGAFTDADVWFKVTVPAGATSITIDTKNIGMSDGAMTVYEGNGTCPNLTMTQIACIDDGSFFPGMPKLTLTNPPGTILYVRMYGHSGDLGTFGICVTADATPPNDECNGAEELAVNTSLLCFQSRNGSTQFSTASSTPTPPSCAVFNSWNDDVWYKFTATSTAHLIQLYQTFSNALPEMCIVAYSGTCNALTQIGCNSSTVLSLPNLAIGSTYFVRVFTKAVDITTYSAFSICISTYQPLTNDQCINSITLNVNEISSLGLGDDCTAGTFGHTFNATASIVTTNPNCGVYNSWDDDVWYKFTCTTPRQQILLSNVSGNVTMGMSLYSGVCGNHSVFNFICCSISNSINVGDLIVGNTYYIRVYTNAISTPEISYNALFSICVNSYVPPENDECTNAKMLSVNQGVICSKGNGQFGSTFGATASTNVQNPDCGLPNGWDDDVWYKFVATGTNHQINFDASAYASAGNTNFYYSLMSLAVYKGDCNSLVLLKCDFNISHMNLFGLTIGDTYYIRVYTNTTYTSCNLVNGKFYICVSKLCEYEPDVANLKNPYVAGVFGNWRADSTYSYYGTRKETDPSEAVDIRTGGTITGYKDFWNFNPNTNNEVNYYLKRNYVANREWAWNSTSTQFNRKGYETENKDPLGRFNAGVYGYNQQLPVAVANNARLREVMYDGFEDYDYKTTQGCNQTGEDCAIPARHAIFKDLTVANLTTQEHHTGRYSLKVAPGTSVVLGSEIKNASAADEGYGFNMNVTSKNCPDTNITLYGTGYNMVQNNGIPLQVGPFPRINDQNISFSYTNKFPITVIWDGTLLPTSTGMHDFQFTFTDDIINMKIYSGATQIFSLSQNLGDPPVIGSVLLDKGKLYYVLVTYRNTLFGGAISNLIWRTPLMKCLGLPYTSIPFQHIYKPTGAGLASAMLSINYVNPRIFYSLEQSQASGNKFNDRFAPLQGTKMVISAWVKESTDCKCSTYVNNSINLLLDGVTTVFKPTGNIIEGWQRYEAFFNIAPDALSMSVSLKNTGTTGDVFFDDVRIHPFNANEKSFVYHSSNLRLMAELDENNYASYYEYDDDGTLTRVKKETQRGIKTITETRSALHVQ
jgi:hypothetical protein